MIELWRRVVIGSGIAVYLLGGGALGSMLVDGLRVDHPRAETRAQRARAASAWPQVRVDAEGRGVRPAAVSEPEVER
jgi:hypothetical protein